MWLKSFSLDNFNIPSLALAIAAEQGKMGKYPNTESLTVIDLPDAR